MLLLAIILSATVAAVANAAAAATPPAPAASNHYAFNPAANSLTFRPGYTIFWNATAITTAFDSTGAPLKGTANADGSETVDKVYTAYPNGTLTGPGIVVVTNGAGAGFRMGKTAFLANGTIVDESGKPIIPTLNADWSYSAGDLKGWPNGTIVGSTGASIYLGAPLSLSPDGTVGYAPPPSPLPPPAVDNAASNYYAFNPATNSLTFGQNYTIAWNATSLTAAVDSTGAPLKAATNAGGSETVDGVYTAYPNGTLTGPGIVLVTNGPTAGFRMGGTTFLKNGTILDGSGKPIVPAANADGSYTAGDLTGWSNGTIAGSTGAVIYLGGPLALSPGGAVAYAAPPPPVPPPPPPKAARSLASPPSGLRAVLTLMLGSLLFM